MPFDLDQVRKAAIKLACLFLDSGGAFTLKSEGVNNSLILFVVLSNDLQVHTCVVVLLLAQQVLRGLRNDEYEPNYYEVEAPCEDLERSPI